MRKLTLALVAGVALIFGAVASGGVISSGVVSARPALGTAVPAAKPGPDDPVPSQPGVIVWDNSGSLKPGVVAGVSTVSELIPDLKGLSYITQGFLAPGNSQSSGAVSCPPRTVAFGGGVNITSSSLQANVNSSFPVVAGGVATGWAAHVNNATSRDLDVAVEAVCATKPANYTVVAADFDNLASSQNRGSVQCPLISPGHRMRVFGGGAFGALASLGQNINTTIPLAPSKSWRTDMNNASDSDSTFTAYAVCGANRPGWSVTAGPAVPNPANSQTSALVPCPSDLSVVSGGVFSSSQRTSVNLNTTVGGNLFGGWVSAENNASSTDFSITPYVVCLP
jgi:hypothetical protein